MTGLNQMDSTHSSPVLQVYPLFNCQLIGSYLFSAYVGHESGGPPTMKPCLLGWPALPQALH